MSKQVIYEHDHNTPNHEIIIGLKCGALDWIDPIQEVWYEGNTLHVDNGYNIYTHDIEDMIDFKIREYVNENIGDYHGGNL